MSLKTFYTENKESILKPTVVMVCICLIVTLALSGANLLTKEKISAIAEEEQQSAMKRLVEADKYSTKTFKDDSGNEVTYYIAESNGKTIGYIFVTSQKGYGGDVQIMTAIGTDQKVLAVDVLDVSTETPGLGQNAAKENFYSQYTDKTNPVSIVKNGASGNEVNAVTGASGNEVNAVTGATVTSKAVTRAVNQALDYCSSIAESNDLQGGETNEP